MTCLSVSYCFLFITFHADNNIIPFTSVSIPGVIIVLLKLDLDIAGIGQAQVVRVDGELVTCSANIESVSVDDAVPADAIVTDGYAVAIGMAGEGVRQWVDLIDAFGLPEVENDLSSPARFLCTIASFSVCVPEGVRHIRICPSIPWIYLAPSLE